MRAWTLGTDPTQADFMKQQSCTSQKTKRFAAVKKLCDADESRQSPSRPVIKMLASITPYDPYGYTINKNS